MFLSRDHLNEATGEYEQYVASTTRITQRELVQYLYQVQQHAREHLGVHLP
jgi:hypothetical protein